MSKLNISICINEKEMEITEIEMREDNKNPIIFPSINLNIVTLNNIYSISLLANLSRQDWEPFKKLPYAVDNITKNSLCLSTETVNGLYAIGKIILGFRAVDSYVAGAIITNIATILVDKGKENKPITQDEIHSCLNDKNNLLKILFARDSERFKDINSIALKMPKITMLPAKEPSVNTNENPFSSTPTLENHNDC
jgi:hypothetical protein